MKAKILILQQWVEQTNPTILTDKTKKYELPAIFRK